MLKKFPPKADCGAKPIACTTPSIVGVCFLISFAKLARFSSFVTSNSKIVAGFGKRPFALSVAPIARPKEVKIGVPPSS